jgi:hypothetical protein
MDLAIRLASSAKTFQSEPAFWRLWIASMRSRQTASIDRPFHWIKP